MPMPNRTPSGGAEGSGDQAFDQKQRADLRTCRAQGAQDSDLRAALRHSDREGVIDDKHPYEEREDAGDVRGQRIDA